MIWKVKIFFSFFENYKLLLKYLGFFEEIIYFTPQKNSLQHKMSGHSFAKWINHNLKRRQKKQKKWKEKWRAGKILDKREEVFFLNRMLQLASNFRSCRLKASHRGRGALERCVCKFTSDENTLSARLLPRFQLYVKCVLSLKYINQLLIS